MCKKYKFSLSQTHIAPYAEAKNEPNDCQEEAEGPKLHNSGNKSHPKTPTEAEQETERKQ